MIQTAQTLTTQQVAARLQLHPITIQRWLRDGTLRGNKLPGRGGWRIPVSEVERMEQGEPSRPTREAVVGTESRQSAALLRANASYQAEQARARGDEDGAARFERIADGMAVSWDTQRQVRAVADDLGRPRATASQDDPDGDSVD